jgi:phenylacetate-CoA ligase
MIEPGVHRGAALAQEDACRAVQTELLHAHVAHCVDNSPFYRDRLSGLDLDPRQVDLESLSGLPLTTKADLEARNDDFLAVPSSRIVDIVLSSGTTGLPTRVMYTEHDLRRLAYNEELSFAACGVTADDVVLLTCTIDRCFVAGLAYFLGVRRLGAAAIRNGHGTLEGHLSVIRDLRPTVAVGVPTFLRKLGLHFRESGEDPAATSIRRMVCIGEPIRDRQLGFLKLGADLEDLWNARAYSTYASSEIISTFCECTAQQGGHLHPDLAILEIVDEDGSPMADGEVGEVVVTPLNVEGMPLIRFATGDLSFQSREPCACGRKTPRLGPIVGRKKQMMKVRGTTLYPQAVHAALDGIPHVVEYYISVDSQADLSDELTVHAAVSDDSCTAGIIAAKLQARLRVTPSVVLEAVEDVRKRVYTPQSRKPIRFVDRRS